MLEFPLRRAKIFFSIAYSWGVGGGIELFSAFGKREREREKKEREKEKERERVGHMQGIGSPTCVS
jgi:hypothetical protein